MDRSQKGGSADERTEENNYTHTQETVYIVIISDLRVECFKCEMLENTIINWLFGSSERYVNCSVLLSKEPVMYLSYAFSVFCSILYPCCFIHVFSPRLVTSLAREWQRAFIEPEPLAIRRWQTWVMFMFRNIIVILFIVLFSFLFLAKSILRRSLYNERMCMTSYVILSWK